jgi:hypothetical protein
MYAECALLEYVLKANTSVALERKGSMDEAKMYRSDFIEQLKTTSIFINSQVVQTKSWIEMKKADRRDKVPGYWITETKTTSTSSTSSTTKKPIFYEKPTKKIGGGRSFNYGQGSTYVPVTIKTNHLGKFEDLFSNRAWQITAREFNSSGRNYQRECDDKMRCMQTWQSYYMSRLEENITEQFKAVKEAMVALTTFCAKPQDYVATLHKVREAH